MGRRRQYESAAERQRACRKRQEAATVRVDRRALDGLHGRLEKLQEVLRVAASQGETTARQCSAASVETMLEKLIHHFSVRAGEGARAEQENKQDG
jgi:hypothetical protein